MTVKSSKIWIFKIWNILSVQNIEYWKLKHGPKIRIYSYINGIIKSCRSALSMLFSKPDFHIFDEENQQSVKKQASKTTQKDKDMTIWADGNGSAGKTKLKATSDIWELYSGSNINNETRYKCSFDNCVISFSINSSTSTLRYHLKKHVLFSDDKCKKVQFWWPLWFFLSAPKEKEATKIYEVTFAIGCVCTDYIFSCR